MAVARTVHSRALIGQKAQTVLPNQKSMWRTRELSVKCISFLISAFTVQLQLMLCNFKLRGEKVGARGGGDMETLCDHYG